MNIFKKINFKLTNPKKKQIILFDGESYRDLKYVLEKFDYFLLENRKHRIYEIYISPIVILCFLSNYLLFFFKNRNPHTIYLLTIINLINPKVIITSICNSGKFHDLARLLDKKFFFLAIQNSSRSADFRRDLHRFKKRITKQNINKNYYIPNYLCYGQNEIDDCKAFDIEVKNFYKTGSVRIANFFEHIKRNQIELNKNKYDLCLISEAAYNLNAKLGENTEEEGFANMVKYSIKYAKDQNLKFIFAKKRYDSTTHSDEEMDFFKKYLSTSEYKFLNDNINKKIDEYSSYLPIFQSKVAIGTQSTLLKDKISCKEKILSLNLTKTNIYDFPIKGVCSIKNCSYEKFKERLDKIFSMSYDEYFSNLDKKYNYVIENSKSENVIDKIRKNIIKNL